jgi:hypothetical protein
MIWTVGKSGWVTLPMMGLVGWLSKEDKIHLRNNPKMNGLLCPMMGTVG